ncbi:unnamed protein product [Spirodela intermedia]|uniref:NB-ARC domain-containing protein n=1 Tax=Spirodela intermedia TaxID=51605 RepID=A0A7I8JRS9_SPIIN|nr:unnamed protein product [Spirodela intermedia]CAA6672455.1 unnamed protein product [Spirodela intermedia]
MEETLSEIHHLLEDNEAGIIRNYNTGAIGKTTLLKAVDDELLGDVGQDSSRFDLVIWVIVSKELDVLKVQEDIGVRLGYCRPGEGQGPTLPRHLHDRATTLLSALSQRRFLLLLDDLWEKLDLGAVGVPVSLRNGSKIVFTTRAPFESGEFLEAVLPKAGKGEDQWDPSMKSLASAVAAKCGGLPLTLITVGRVWRMPPPAASGKRLSSRLRVFLRSLVT